MCLLALAWKTHPRYPLIFAGNRDEFHARPAKAAHWWQDAPAVFGGRDLEAGGSWLGVRRDGRFAVVTNFREPDRRAENMRSRGELVTRFLASSTTPRDYLRFLHDYADAYSGFNLLFGDPGGMFYFSNRHEDHGGGMPLSPGVHALSNHLLNTPWPKVRRLHARFDAEIARPKPRIGAMLDMLGETEQATDASLPDTGITRDWERLLSSAMIVSPAYGTRASTVLMIDNHGKITFHERRFTPSGDIEGDTREHFDPHRASGNIPE